MTTSISTLLTANRVDLHCPVCGKRVVNADPNVPVDPCPHLLFAATDLGTFTFVSEAYQGFTEKALNAHHEYDIDPFAYAVDHLEPDDLLCLSVAGIGFQNYYAFSFDLGDSDEEE